MSIFQNFTTAADLQPVEAAFVKMNNIKASGEIEIPVS